MKVDILSKEETRSMRHFSLDIQVEDKGKIGRINVDIIEEHDLRHNEYRYDIERFSWVSDTSGLNANQLESMLENYLLDNIEDILS